MKEKIVFGRWEGTTLMILLICTQIFLNMPRSAAEAAGAAGWMMIAYVSVIVLIILLIIIRLYRKFEGMDIIQVSEHVAGTPGRIIMGLVIFAHILVINIVTLREFSENMKIISLPASPISFVSLFFIAAMIAGAYVGFEGQVRIVAIVVPVIIAGYIIIGIGVSQFNDFSHLIPILGLGPYKIFVEGLQSVSIFSAVIVLYIMPPFLKTHRTLKSVSYWGVGISALFLTLSVLMYLVVYTYPIAQENFLPLYQLARIINYGRFFQRIESVFLFVWAFAAMLYISITAFLIVYVFKRTFRLEYYKPLILAFTVIIFTASLIPGNLVTSIEIETRFFRRASWITTFAVPILFLAAGNIIKKPKKGLKNNEKN